MHGETFLSISFMKRMSQDVQLNRIGVFAEAGDRLVLFEVFVLEITSHTPRVNRIFFSVLAYRCVLAEGEMAERERDD